MSLENLYTLLDVLITVVMYSAIISAPIIILILLMYLYRRYKKWAGTEKKKPERIIVKMNDPEEAKGESGKPRSTEEILLEISKRLFDKPEEQENENTSSDEPTAEDPVIEEIDYSKMTIKELHAIAKKRKLVRYSRLKKTELIKLLK